MANLEDTKLKDRLEKRVIKEKEIEKKKRYRNTKVINTHRKTPTSFQGEYCKLIPGIHNYKSYTEMCKVLNIPKAKRGKEKEEQFKKLSKYYIIKLHKNSSITLTYYTAREKREMSKKRKELKRKQKEESQNNL